MIDSEGDIIDHELHSPFAYLRSLVDEFSTEKPQECGSEQPLGGAQNQKDGNYQTVFLIVNRARFTSTKRNTLLNDVAHHPF